MLINNLFLEVIENGFSLNVLIDMVFLFIGVFLFLVFLLWCISWCISVVVEVIARIVCFILGREYEDIGTVDTHWFRDKNMQR